ncbi:MAG TPA: Smr/MutS family protein [Acidobacteriaceae bacterium]|nr:Smr/MutS family protein [Acidobacteriaceae bacterium]
MTKEYTRYDWKMGLLPEIPGMLVETAAGALEWPRLREHIASLAASPLGRGWILALEPSANAAWIDAQQQRTAEIRGFLTGGGSFDFAGMFDPTALLDEARVEGVALEGQQINTLLSLIERLAAWRAAVRGDRGSVHPTRPQNTRTDGAPGHSVGSGIVELSEPIVGHDFAPLLHALRGKIEPDGSLSDDASHELRRIRRAMERQHRAIEESLRKSLRALSSEGSTQEELITVRGERFVIPVKAEFRRRVPGVIHGSSSSGQTVFIEPLETIEQNNELVRLLDEEQREIHRILVAMTGAIGEQADAILAGTSVLAEIESHFARARFANELACVRPVFADRLELSAARHPLLELRLRRTGEAPVPTTLALEPAARQLVISGPNTGGKTVALKTVGLLALMAQAGLPVPAEAATLPMLEAIYADIGDAQSIESALSSFSAHVLNVDRIARVANADSLVLLDELGSATDPEEGAALAVAVAEHFLAARAWTCITTHLTSMKVYAARSRDEEHRADSSPPVTLRGTNGAPRDFFSNRVLNAAVGFDQATLSPTYELRLGVPGASAGLNIAERLGLSPEILAEARAQLTTQAADIGALLDQLHMQLTEIARERNELNLRESQLSRDREKLEAEGRAEQKARTKELEAKLNALLGEFEGELKEIVKQIDDKALARKIQRDSALRTARARREFAEEFQQAVVAHVSGADKGALPTAAKPRTEAAREIKAGDLVKLRSLGREGRVARVIDAKNYEVTVGTMKMRVPASDIVEVTPVAAVTPIEAARRKGGVTIQTANNPDYTPMEINVIGRTADEAHDEVSRFIDQAFLAGLPHVRIVHGTGMGVLRRTLREFLRSHPNVANISEPPHNQGGQGATEVDLRQ